MRIAHFLGRVTLSALLLPVLQAASFSGIVAFGDSLSDAGNVEIATSGLFPGPNYAGGRFTNGANTNPASSGPSGLWVDQLAARLGLPDPQPYLAGTGGTNYAFASATTGSNGLYNISDQLSAFALTHPGGADASALYTFWGGANDLFNAANAPSEAADNLLGNIQSLAAAGAKNFLWINLPPLGNTPRAVAGNNVAALASATIAFNMEWASDVQLLRGMGIDVVGVDAYSLFSSIAAEPSAYGFSNITFPAQGMANVNPDNYLFWDIQHPTTAGHAQVANSAYDSLVAVPEPVTGFATLLGLAGLLGLRRARKARSAAFPFPQAPQAPQAE